MMRAEFKKPVAMLLVMMLLFTLVPAGAVWADTTDEEKTNVTVEALTPTIGIGQTAQFRIIFPDTEADYMSYIGAFVYKSENAEVSGDYEASFEDEISETIPLFNKTYTVSIPLTESTVTTGSHIVVINAHRNVNDSENGDVSSNEYTGSAVFNIVDYAVNTGGSSGGGGYTYVPPKKTTLEYVDKNNPFNPGQVSFQPEDGTELPRDAELVVKPFQPSLGDLNLPEWKDVNTKYISLDDENIQIVELFSLTWDGVTYHLGELIVIDGTEYIVTGLYSGEKLYIMRLTDGSEFIMHLRTGVMEFSGDQYYREMSDRLNINGVTYDVVAQINVSGISEDRFDTDIRTYWVLYYEGKPVGRYYPNQGRADFHGKYDPATLKAQKDNDFLGFVTIPEKATSSNAREQLVADLEAAMKALDETIQNRGSGYLNGYRYWDGGLKQQLESLGLEFDEMNRFLGDWSGKITAEERERCIAVLEAQRALDEFDALVEQLRAGKKYRAYVVGAQDIYVKNVDEAVGTVTQKFTLPEKYANDPNVTYAAIHTAEQGNEFGTVNVAEGGNTLEAVYHVTSMSPFVVYAFVEHTDRIVMQIDNRIVLANDRTFTTDAPPVIVDGRTMVPVRVITEAFGGTARWNGDTNTVTLEIDGNTLSMTVGEPIPGFDAASVILNNRTYVPVRYIAEAVGAAVSWEAGTRQIVIER